MKKYWKIIVVLGIFAILYLGGTAVKHSQSEDDRNSEPSEDQTIEEWMEENLPPWINNFPRTSVELDPDTFIIPEGETTQIRIKSSKDDDYRDASFNFEIEGCPDFEDCPDTSDLGNCCPNFKLKISYRASRAEKGDADLKEQEWPMSDKKNDMSKASFTILKDRGIITFDNSASEKPVTVKQKK